MTDIVERLRLLVPSDSSGAAFDAINEITRLGSELHIAQEWSSRVIAGREQDIAEITALRAEVERLKKEVLFTAISVLPEKDAENERLKEWNREIALNAREFAAENERLRAALKTAGQTYPADGSRLIHSQQQIIDIARAALEER